MLKAALWGIPLASGSLETLLIHIRIFTIKVKTGLITKFPILQLFEPEFWLDFRKSASRAYQAREDKSLLQTFFPELAQQLCILREAFA